ncbi:helix-turn-helix domain-containing protein [Streptomyces ipomoeae]|uniref:helix-turn-helix domain-containing protein n=1 Tax=Streptomyces ipomoeae TaxID=103232 RepID=UPI0029C0B2AB|nr:helix-turn-helix domain-containing protein [Streptomyces ipomoeae]
MTCGSFLALLFRRELLGPQLVQADEDTVRDVIHRFNEIGLACLDPQWPGGRPRQLGTDDEDFVIQTATTRPRLMSLICGLQSLIEYWADRPGDALFYAQKGTALAVDLQGTVGLWLLGLQARAAAFRGDEETVQTSNRAAADRREHVIPDDLDQLGGLLTYSLEKQRYYAVEASAILGDGNADLTAQAELAVQGFRDPANPNWAFGDLAGAQCNLALIHIHSGDVDGAAEAIRPVLDLPANFRNNGIVVSALRVRQALMTNGVRTALTARDLREELAVHPPRRPALPGGTQR